MKLVLPKISKATYPPRGKPEAPSYAITTDTTIGSVKNQSNQSYLVPSNQDLSGAKSELQGETVGVFSFYKRGGQPLYNSALRSLQMCLFVHI